MRAIRGAVCAQNTAESIGENSLLLVGEILKQNKIDASQVNAIFFSTTADLDAAYPAKFVRQSLQMDKVAFMCFQEMNVDGSLPHCIRVTVFADGGSQDECVACYLGDAKSLRPDLAK